MNPQFTSGEVVTAAKLNELPKGVLGYAQVTADQAGIGTTPTDLTGLTVTVTVVAGRRLRITGQHQIQQLTAAGGPVGQIREGSTTLNRYGRADLASGGVAFFSGSHVLTPTAGSHTYKLTLNTSAGTVTMAANANLVAFILVEDIGAST